MQVVSLCLVFASSLHPDLPTLTVLPLWFVLCCGGTAFSVTLDHQPQLVPQPLHTSLTTLVEAVYKGKTPVPLLCQTCLAYSTCCVELADVNQETSD